MIVVDTNILVYYMIDGDNTVLAKMVKDCDPEWVLPSLWKHEFINVLSVICFQKQKKGEAFSQYNYIWNDAADFFSENEIQVDLSHALELAVKNKISTYDAQFVTLAKELNLKLVTADREILRKFPETAVSMEDFTKDSGFTLVRERRAGYGVRRASPANKAQNPNVLRRQGYGGQVEIRNKHGKEKREACLSSLILKHNRSCATSSDMVKITAEEIA